MPNGIGPQYRYPDKYCGNENCRALLPSPSAACPVCESAKRIATLESDLATERERNAALAAALQRFHTLAATLSMLPSERQTQAEKLFVREASNHPDVEAILAAHDAEVRKPLEGQIAAYRNMIAASGHDMDTAGQCNADCLTCAEVSRAAKVEALENARKTWHSLRMAPDVPGVFIGDEMAKYLGQSIAALKEGGKG